MRSDKRSHSGFQEGWHVRQRSVYCEGDAWKWIRLGYRVLPRSRPKLPHCSGWRSEEHTSELQSRENLVCRLLLEKKKSPAEQDAEQVPYGHSRVSDPPAGRPARSDVRA